MIFPLSSHRRATGTIEELSAAIAEMIAHPYLYAGTELAKHPDDPASELLLDTLFKAIGDFDDIAKNTSGETVREVLGTRDNGSRLALAGMATRAAKWRGRPDRPGRVV